MENLKNIFNNLIKEYKEASNEELERFVKELKKGVKFNKPVHFLVNDVDAYYITKMKINKETMHQYNISIKTQSAGELKFRIKKYRINVFYKNLNTDYKVL